MNTVLQVKSLKITYPRSHNPLIQIPEWYVEEGELWIILGANGSGKTTILYSITGIIPLLIKAKVEGKIRISGENPFNSKDVFRKATLLLQNPYDQLTQSTVENEIIFPLANLGIEKKKIRVALSYYLNYFGIDSIRFRNPQTLSSGEAQKTLLSSMFSREPNIFLFDEPEAHLDFKGKTQLFKIIKKILESGKTVIITTHAPENYISLDPKFLFIKQNTTYVYRNLRDLFKNTSSNEIIRLSYEIQKNYDQFIKDPYSWQWENYSKKMVEEICL